MKAILTLVVPALLATSPTPPPAPTAPDTKTVEQAPLEIPTDLRGAIRTSITLGREIYLQDKASAIGTDVLFEHTNKSDRESLGGYLTVREGGDDLKPTGSWVVMFFTKGQYPRVAYRITIPMGSDKAPEYQALSPPEPLLPGVGILIRARQNALEAAKPFTQPINPVILPADLIGEKGILVMLIAGTDKPNLAVLGRHYRVLVSEDGETVKSVTPLSNGALELPTIDSQGGRVVALAASQIVTDYPVETHVLTSMLTGLPIYLATARGLWCVDRDSIRYVSKEIPGASK